MVGFAIGIESLCSIFLCVAAASNVSSQSWHPLALVLIIVLVGSTAHGIIATCKQLAAPGLFSPCRFTLKPCCLQCTAHKYFFVSVSRAFRPHPRHSCQGRFCIAGAWVRRPLDRACTHVHHASQYAHAFVKTIPLLFFNLFVFIYRNTHADTFAHVHTVQRGQ